MNKSTLKAEFINAKIKDVMQRERTETANE